MSEHEKQHKRDGGRPHQVDLFELTAKAGTVRLEQTARIGAPVWTLALQGNGLSSLYGRMTFTPAELRELIAMLAEAVPSAAPAAAPPTVPVRVMEAE